MIHRNSHTVAFPSQVQRRARQPRTFAKIELCVYPVPHHQGQRLLGRTSPGIRPERDRMIVIAADGNGSVVLQPGDHSLRIRTVDYRIAGEHDMIHLTGISGDGLQRPRVGMDIRDDEGSHVSGPRFPPSLGSPGKVLPGQCCRQNRRASAFSGSAFRTS